MSKIADFLTNNGLGTGPNGSGLPTIFTSLKAGEAVQKGDILTLGGDALVYYAQEPGALGSALRPLSSVSAVQNAPLVPLITISPAVPVPGSGSAISATALADGNMLVGWRTTASVNIAIYRPDGTPVLAATNIESGPNPASGSMIKVKALVGGGFAVGWGSYVGTIFTPRFAIFNAAGERQGSIINVENPATSVVTLAIDIVQLQNGNIVFAYGCYNGTNYQPRFSIYSTAGVAQASNVQVDSSMTVSLGLAISSFAMLVVAALTGGGFVYGFSLYDGTNSTPYFRRYDNAGAAQGARVPLGATTAVNGAPVGLVAMTDGGFVVSGAASIRKYDASGTGLGAATTGLAYGHCITPLAGGTYRVAACEGATGLHILVFNAAGVQVGSTIKLGAGTAANSPVSEVALQDGSLVFSYPNTVNARFTRTDANLNVIGTADTQVSNGAGATSAVFGFSLVNPINTDIPNFGVLYGGSIGVAFGTYFSGVQKMTLIGVAASSAPKNGDVSVQISGVATLRQPFKVPYVTDTRANATPGQKLSVVGNTAVLMGIQA